MQHMPSCCPCLAGNCSRSDFGCYLSDTGDECVAMELKCDGIIHCSHGEDEMDCCATNQFGCYIEDDTYQPLGGGSVIRYHCLYNSSRCDGVVDCLNLTIDEPLDCEWQLADLLNIICH